MHVYVSVVFAGVPSVAVGPLLQSPNVQCRVCVCLCLYLDDEAFFFVLGELFSSFLCAFQFCPTTMRLGLTASLLYISEAFDLDDSFSSPVFLVFFSGMRSVRVLMHLRRNTLPLGSFIALQKQGLPPSSFHSFALLTLPYIRRGAKKKKIHVFYSSCFVFLFGWDGRDDG